jgi:hypothetical protein
MSEYAIKNYGFKYFIFTSLITHLAIGCCRENSNVFPFHLKINSTYILEISCSGPGEDIIISQRASENSEPRLSLIKEGYLYFALSNGRICLIGWEGKSGESGMIDIPSNCQIQIETKTNQSDWWRRIAAEDPRFFVHHYEREKVKSILKNLRTNPLSQFK